MILSMVSRLAIFGMVESLSSVDLWVMFGFKVFFIEDHFTYL